MASLSLYELNNLVHALFDLHLAHTFWLQAELSEVRESRGHCFVEFVQKEEQGNGLLAKARGQIWASTWAMLRPYFERTTHQQLTAGMQVLVEVKVTFHEVYGYALNVVDIDPAYTLGDIARRRQEILQQLEREGVLTMNKEIPLPRLLQRIAVISSASAAGFQDFERQLADNRHHLAFHTRLFPAVMQGNEVEGSIIRALNAILDDDTPWDAVVIIRGGGSTSDLSGFDTLTLAENVAQFPLPVITGIGHERDDTVIDMVSHTRVKTPTAAAEFLIHHQLHELETVNTLTETLTRSATHILQHEQQRMVMLASQLPTLFQVRRTREEVKLQRLLSSVSSQAARQWQGCGHHIDLVSQRLANATQAQLSRWQHQLDLAEKQIQSAQPDHLLQLGFSITRINGKAVTRPDQVQAGDILTTTLAEGELRSTVTQ